MIESLVDSLRCANSGVRLFSLLGSMLVLGCAIFTTECSAQDVMGRETSLIMVHINDSRVMWCIVNHPKFVQTIWSALHAAGRAKP